jgi:uncharacterized membrane protein
MRNALDSTHHEGHKGHEETQKTSFVHFVSFVVNKLFTRENIWAFVLFLIVVALIILTTDDSPNWIYQGF